MDSKDPDTIQVLLIDDDAAYAAVAQHMLRNFQGKKFKLVWKEDGEKGLEEIASNSNLDVILLDHFLPKKTGLDVVKQMWTAKIEKPTIFLTTSKDFRLAIEAMKYGVEDYLVKGEAVDTILPRTIVSVLDRVRLKKQISAAEKGKLIAQRSAEATQELIVAICHEFNNPLAAVKISCDIVSRQNLAEEERSLLVEFAKNLALLEKEVSRLRDIHWDLSTPKEESKEKTA
jgi:DNA-binding NtrC family response regulator